MLNTGITQKCKIKANSNMYIIMFHKDFKNNNQHHQSNIHWKMFGTSGLLPLVCPEVSG